MPAPFYVVMTNPSQEQIATRNLSRLGYEILFLHYVKIVRHARRVREVIRPYLPGYIFVRVPEHMGFYAVNTAQGVLSVLGSDSGPIPIRADEIDRMRTHGDENGLVGTIGEDVDRKPEYESGQDGKIISGPLMDRHATVIVDLGKEIRLNVEAFGQVVEVRVAPETFSPAQRSFPKKSA